MINEIKLNNSFLTVNPQASAQAAISESVVDISPASSPVGYNPQPHNPSSRFQINQDSLR